MQLHGDINDRGCWEPSCNFQNDFGWGRRTVQIWRSALVAQIT